MEIRTGTARISAAEDDLDIHYEDMGKISDPPVLLIMGLGAQLLLWRKGFCERLVNLGYRVIRYDNRDVGLSGKLHGRRAGGSLIPALVRSFVGRRSESVYTLEHMADDAARSRVAHGDGKGRHDVRAGRCRDRGGFGCRLGIRRDAPESAGAGSGGRGGRAVRCRQVGGQQRRVARH